MKRSNEVNERHRRYKQVLLYKGHSDVCLKIFVKMSYFITQRICISKEPIRSLEKNLTSTWAILPDKTVSSLPVNSKATQTVIETNFLKMLYEAYHIVIVFPRMHTYYLKNIMWI